MNDPKIPTIGEYRGVRLHAWQNEQRLKLVRTAIDRVYALQRVQDLAAFASDPNEPPEARIYAAVRAEAEWDLSTDRREQRPDVDMARLRASVVGLDDLDGVDPDCFGSLLQPSGQRRDAPLTDEQMSRDRSPRRPLDD